jgi:hypothetical protein
VSLAPGSEHGFAYLQDADGKLDKRKLRPYRGYLNALGGEAIKGIASIFRNLAPTRAKLKPLVEAIETNGKLIEGWRTERTKERQAELVKQVPAAAQTPAPGPVAAERLQRAQRRRVSRHQRQKAEAVTARSPARSSAFSIHWRPGNRSASHHQPTPRWRGSLATARLLHRSPTREAHSRPRI